MRGNRAYRKTAVLQQKITARTGSGRDELVKQSNKNVREGDRERETKAGREERMWSGSGQWS